MIRRWSVCLCAGVVVRRQRRRWRWVRVKHTAADLHCVRVREMCAMEPSATTLNAVEGPGGISWRSRLTRASCQLLFIVVSHGHLIHNNTNTNSSPCAASVNNTYTHTLYNNHSQQQLNINRQVTTGCHIQHYTRAVISDMLVIVEF